MTFSDRIGKESKPNFLAEFSPRARDNYIYIFIIYIKNKTKQDPFGIKKGRARAYARGREWCGGGFATAVATKEALPLWTLCPLGSRFWKSSAKL